MPYHNKQTNPHMQSDIHQEYDIIVKAVVVGTFGASAHTSQQYACTTQDYIKLKCKLIYSQWLYNLLPLVGSSAPSLVSKISPAFHMFKQNHQYMFHNILKLD